MNDKMKFTYDSKLKYKNLLDEEELLNMSSIKQINSKFGNCSLLFSKNYEKEINYDFDDLDNNRNNNMIMSYYYSTAKYLKYSNENKDYLLKMINSKNYIPKFKNNILFRNNYKDNKYNVEYIYNDRQIKNCIYELNNNNFYQYEQQLNYIKEYNNNNLIISPELILGNNKVGRNINSNTNNNLIKEKEKHMNNGYLEKSNSKSPNNKINNIYCPPFIPSNFKIQQGKDVSRKSSNDSLSKDRESDSTSAFSEKREEENNFEILNKAEKRKYSELYGQNLENVDYLVEMFGRKGWICKLCNNFNYETRNKCNRCGIMKKPKILVDLKSNKEQRVLNDVKERNNKKGDWICINCRNLNYCFRTFCNRCKIPKIDPILKVSNVLNSKEVNNIQKYQIYAFSPSMFFFNNVPNRKFENMAIK